VHKPVRRMNPVPRAVPKQPLRGQHVDAKDGPFAVVAVVGDGESARRVAFVLEDGEGSTGSAGHPSLRSGLVPFAGRAEVEDESDLGQDGRFGRRCAWFVRVC